jgi:DNA invertase Pin-like site-specific DNA recombinase
MDARRVTDAYSDPSSVAIPVGLRSDKIQQCHLNRLAIVYIRQSTPQQVQRNRESIVVQYGLKDRAIALGWAPDRVLIIDEDLGKSGASSADRQGFQRIVAEVSLDHAGIILGVEMSRLARSCTDWYNLLEVCGIFRTLIADVDGVYAPYDFNDRLLLGLKGTMSEAELHILTQRMWAGKLKKAERCELFTLVAMGYVRLASGQVVLDPDEEVQSVVRLIFRIFEERGTINGVLRYLADNGVRLGVRPHYGPNRGQVEWGPPYREAITAVLRNPIYAGAYAYGRRQVDHKRKKPGQRGSSRPVVDMTKWKVLERDRLPAYISWEQYEGDLKRLAANRSHAESIGAARRGTALLSGLLRCGRCGRRMTPYYIANSKRHRYVCSRARCEGGGPLCQSLSGGVVDAAVESSLLRALAPASLELSVQAASNIESARRETHRHWERRLERAEFEAERTRCQYDLCEPENRLVARTLERQWEQKLIALHGLREEYNRFLAEKSRRLSGDDIDAIRGLSSDIPRLWNSDRFPVTAKKSIARELIEQVCVTVVGQSEKVHLSIRWAGGHETQVETTRHVARANQLSNYSAIVGRVRDLVTAGVSTKAIAGVLTEEGYRPAGGRRQFGWVSVSELMRREGITPKRVRAKTEDPLVKTLGPDEWTLASLAQRLDMPSATLYYWQKRGKVRVRVVTVGRIRRRVIQADEAEIQRLQQYRSASLAEMARQRWPGASRAEAQKEPSL